MNMRRNKPKFDKKKCLKCRYHGTGCGGYPVKLNDRGITVTVYCNYTTLMDDTCLKRVKGEIVDRRGEDYHDCKLFEEGKAMEDDDE